MIRSFRDRETERLFRRVAASRIPPQIQRSALRKLDGAESLEDLRVPPGNRLERLRGDREGQYSVRVNDQWRVSLSGAMEMRTMSKSPTTIERSGAVEKRPAPVHPGEILQEEFLNPLQSASTALPGTSVCRRDGSTRSCTRGVR